MKLITLIFIFLMILFQINCKNSCNNELLSEIISPDKQFKIFIFQRDCGATTGFSFHISILKKDELLPNESGNVLILDNKKTELLAKSLLLAEWIDSKFVQIKYNRSSRIFLSNTQLKVPINFFKSEIINIKFISE